MGNFKLYHVSNNFELNKLTPKLPDNVMNNEDYTEKRVCASMSINGCLSAVGKYNIGDILGVYEINFTKEEFAEKVKQPSYREVLDSPLTGELWILEEVEVNLFITIQIEDIIYNKFEGMDNEMVKYSLLKNIIQV